MTDTPKRQGDEFDWSLRDGETAVVYACGVDWQHHTLCDADGMTVFGSVADLEAARPCTPTCGVVELHLKMVGWVKPQNLFGDEKGNGP